MERIFENLYKIDVPLPGSPLKALSVYVILGDRRNLMVDCGFNHPDCEKAIRDGLQALGVSLDDTDIFLTHLHADHTGLCERLMTGKNKVYISSIDGKRVNGFLQQSYWDKLMTYQDFMGFPVDRKLDFHVHPAFKNRTDKPVMFTDLHEGDIFELGGYRFETVDIAGHTPGQMGLFDREKSILICGDHILAKISPNINFWDFEADYLGLYLKNLKKVKQMAVKHLLTAHRARILDADKRIDELLSHHAERLNEICSILNKGEQTVFQVAAEMQWDFGTGSFLDFPPQQKWFAGSEVFAHLEHLVCLEKVSRRKNGDTFLYQNI